VRQVVHYCNFLCVDINELFFISRIAISKPFKLDFEFNTNVNFKVFYYRLHRNLTAEWINLLSKDTAAI
jgi:hypothetical protein